MNGTLDYDASQALDPNEAATLFRSGSELAFLTDPYTGFVMGRWLNAPVICLAVPADLVAYFTTNPVIVYGTYVPPPPGEPVRAVISIAGAGWRVRGNNMAVELPNGKVVDLTVAFEDADGNPASAPGAVTWESSDTSIATVEPDADDDTQSVVTSVAEGTSTITASAGSISATIDINISAEGGDAVSANITAGEPYDPDAPNQGLPESLPGQTAGRTGARPGQQPAPRPGQPVRQGATLRPAGANAPAQRPAAPVAGRTAAPIRRG
jgi:hypothetical protein